MVVPFPFPLSLDDPLEIDTAMKENTEECSMCHVNDPCASSPQLLDQIDIRWMVEMEWSCASLHTSTMSVK